MRDIEVLLERNRAFARSDARRSAPGIMPRQGVFVVTCLDPRVDPAAVLGLQLGDAPVVRNAGGRVTSAVIEDVAFISYLVEAMGLEGPLFEVAVIQHTQCGTGFLADDSFRRGFAERTGFDAKSLAAEAVIDPAATVRSDVGLLLAAPQVSPRLTVSGHVYDLETGLVSTVVGATAPHRA